MWSRLERWVCVIVGLLLLYQARILTLIVLLPIMGFVAAQRFSLPTVLKEKLDLLEPLSSALTHAAKLDTSHHGLQYVEVSFSIQKLRLPYVMKLGVACLGFVVYLYT